MQILLVGITAESRTVIDRAFASRGHEPLAAVDGTTGLDVIRKASPAFVVVEDALADMTAAEFCRAARAFPQGADAVILVITAIDHELTAVLEAGATDLYMTSLGPAALETRLLIAERLVEQHARLRNRELRFRRLFESGVTGVTIADLDGNFKEANGAFLAMLGYTHDDMRAGAVNWQSITPLDRLVPDTEARAQLRNTGFLPLREKEYVHKDGRHIAVLVGSAALEGTSEYISYVTDISARKREEEALRASEGQYRALFEYARFAKVLFDRETLGVVAVNDVALGAYGYSRDEFLQMNLTDIEPGGDLRASLGDFARSHVSNPLGVHKHTKKDGSTIDRRHHRSKLQSSTVARAVWPSWST